MYDNIFSNNNIDKFDSYKILEIGIDTGHWIESIKKYFPNSEIYGLDIKDEKKTRRKEYYTDRKEKRSKMFKTYLKL